MLKRILRTSLPILLVAGAVLGALALVRSKPQPEVVEPEIILPLVEALTVRGAALQLVVKTQGTILARTESTLAAQVSAEVIRVSPSFEVGGFLNRGETLLQLDPRDFELAVRQGEAAVARATHQIELEEAAARIAAKEWETLGVGEPEPLVLHGPQLQEARAVLAAAEAQLEMARLALERTEIRAPFDGRIRDKMVDIGEYVVAGQNVAVVQAIDWVDVRLPISQQELAYLDVPLPGMDESHLGRKAPDVRLSGMLAGKRHSWWGKIVRTVGELDPGTRMIHLVGRVGDPYGRRKVSAEPQVPLTVGLFVEAEVLGRKLEGVYLIPPEALRERSRILVIDAEDRLRFREVEILRQEEDFVILDSGLNEGERICVSRLDVVMEGMRVRTAEATPLEVPDPSLPASERAAERFIVEAQAHPAEAHRGALTGVEIEGDGSNDLFLRIRGEIKWRGFGLSAPDRYVIDLLDTVDLSAAASWTLDGTVAGVRLAQFTPPPEPITRVVFDLRRSVAPTIEERSDGLLVRFP